MNVFYTIYYVIVVFVFMILIWSVMMVGFVLSFAVDKNRYVMMKLSYWFSFGFMHLCPLWHIKIKGGENMEKGKTYVVTVNHQSMLDTTLLSIAMGNAYGKFVSKREVYKLPFFGWVLWMRRDIAIDRSSATAFMKVIRTGRYYINKGISIFIFPEGTRSKDGEIHKYKESAFALAKGAGAEILPCVINGTHNVLRGGWLTKREMVFEILPPIDMEQICRYSPKEMAERVQKLTQERLEEIRNKK